MMPGFICDVRRLPRLVFILVLALPLVASQARAEDVDREFTFAEKLVDWGFPDYANKLMDAIVKTHPDQAGRAKLVKAEGLIAARKFADAQAVINEFSPADPKADTVRLALANGYYRFGELDKARQLYNEFFSRFKQPPSDADLLRFYRDAAFRYAQMLKQADDYAGAVDALGKLLSTNPDKNIARPVMAEQAQMYVDLARKVSGGDRDKYLGQAAKICKDIQWQGVDEWFGHSIITMANIELVRGDRAKAKKLIDKDYADILKEIDKQLREANAPLGQSPMAGARFLLGEMYQQDGEALLKDASKKDDAIAALGKALVEYYNVFVQYGDSDWGPDAGLRANAIKSQLEGLGKTVKIDLGAQAEKAAATQFRIADNLYRQKQYGDAARDYLKALNAYPETAASARALGTLMACYVELNDTLMVKTLAEYVAERFAGRDEGAIALLAAASLYINRKDDAMSTYLYEAYLRGFPKHEKAGTILFYLGNQRRKVGDNDGADYYFQRIVDNYPQDQYYPTALRLIARGYYDLGHYDQAIAAFKKLIGDIPPGPDRAASQFSLADCYVKLGKWAEAAVELNQLVKWLEPEKGNPYAGGDDAKRVDLLVKSKFQLANCFGRMTEPADRVPAFRAAAIDLYTEVFTKFASSSLAPKAMMGKGQIQLGLGQTDAAAKTFDELAAKFPQSEEGKNALYSLARSAMEIGQFDQAKGAFEKMMANAATYSPDEFTRLGQLMIDAKLYDEAIRAFRQVIDNKKIQDSKDLPESRALLERSLYGVSSALYEKKDYSAAVASLEQFTNQFPRSGLFFEAHFLLGESEGALGEVGRASEVISEIFRYSQDQDQINRASMKLAEIQLKGGDKRGALASYQRIALLADPNKAEQRPQIEQAILRGLPISMELGMYKDALDSCDQYLKLFPTSDKVGEIRRIRAEANLKASTAGGSSSPPESPPPAP